MREGEIHVSIFRSALSEAGLRRAARCDANVLAHAEHDVANAATAAPPHGTRALSARV